MSDPFKYHVLDAQALVDGKMPYQWPIDDDSIGDVAVGTLLVNDEHAGIFRVEDIIVSKEERDGQQGKFYLLVIDAPGGGAYDEVGHWKPGI